MNWEMLLYLIPYLFSVSISIGVGVYAWRRRNNVAGAAQFAWYVLVEAFLTVGFILELLSPDLEAKIFWDHIQFVGMFAVPLTFLNFARQFLGRTPYSRRTWVVMSIVPLISLLLIFTDPLHRLIRPTSWVLPGVPFSGFSYEFTPPVWLMAIYVYGMIIIGLSLLVSEFAAAHPLYRAQIGTILLGILIPIIGSLLTLAGVELTFNRDTTPFTFAIGNLIVAWGLFRYRLFDIMPVARHKVIESMPDGVMVVDNQARLTYLNPAVEQVINRTAAEVVGQPVAQVLSNWPDLVEEYQDVAEAHIELVTDVDGRPRHLDLKISPLRDHHDRPTGRLVVVRDITQRKHTENALRESEEKYRRLVESTEDLVWAMDLKGRAIFCKEAIKKLLSYAVEEFVGNAAIKLTHPDWQEQIQELFQRAILQKTGWTDLIIRWLPDGTRTFVNESYCRYLNRSRDQLIGENFLSEYPEDRRKALQEKLTMLTPENPESIAEQYGGLPSGRSAWLRWIDRAIFDESGQVIEYQSVGRDVTKRKQTEAELIKYREHLEELVEERTMALQKTNAALTSRVEELSILNYITQTATRATDLQTALEIVSQQITNLFDAHSSPIALIDAGYGRVRNLPSS